MNSRLSVATLNMPDTVESCEEQLRIMNYALHCTIDSGDSGYYYLITELCELLWKEYKLLGGSADQPGDLVKWGRARVLQQIMESDRP